MKYMMKKIKQFENRYPILSSLIYWSLLLILAGGLAVFLGIIQI